MTSHTIIFDKPLKKKHIVNPLGPSTRALISDKKFLRQRAIFKGFESLVVLPDTGSKKDIQNVYNMRNTHLNFLPVIHFEEYTINNKDLLNSIVIVDKKLLLPMSDLEIKNSIVIAKSKNINLELSECNIQNSIFVGFKDIAISNLMLRRISEAGATLAGCLSRKIPI